MILWLKSNRLLSILIIVALAFFIYYIFNAVKWIPYPNSVDYGEGFVMNYANLWANGTWEWDINVPPYLTMAYGVGFPILAYPFVKLFGAELWVGRSISLVATLVVCFLIYLIVKELTGKKIYGLLAALLPATQPAFRDWSIMARVDMPAVMLGLMGFYIAVRFKDSKHFFWCVIPFILAVMVKQIAIAALLAVMLYLLIYNRKQLLVFSGLFVSGLAVLLTPLMIISGGTYWKHIALYMNGIENINISLFNALFPAFFYPFIALLFLSLVFLRRCWHRKEFTMASLFFAVAFIVNAVASSKTGASCIYYYEAIFAGSICAGLSLPYLLLYAKRKRLKLNAVTVACGLVALLFIVMPIWYVKYPDQRYTNDMNIARVVMGDSEKPIISENPALALDMGKDVYIEYFIFTNMTRLGYWDETPYVENYKNQDFDYILMRVSLDTRLDNMSKGYLDGHFLDVVLNAINQNYTLVYESEAEVWLHSVYVYEANEKLGSDERFMWRDGKLYRRI